MTHSLTDVERLSLLNQYKILRNLDTTHDRAWYDLRIEILEKGYEGKYSVLFDHLDDPLGYEQCGFVKSVLTMFHGIDNYAKETDVSILEEPHAVFEGFDPTTESKLLAFAAFLVANGYHEEQKKYVSQNHNMHSDRPMAGRYRRMLERWEGMGMPLHMNREQVIHVLHA